MPRTYYVYILASKRNGTIYIGMTNNLIRRLAEHRTGRVRWDPPNKRQKPKSRLRAKAFGFRYDCHRLVYYETFCHPSDAIDREKQLKEWRRAWKVDLIERNNPGWKELSDGLH